MPGSPQRVRHRSVVIASSAALERRALDASSRRSRFSCVSRARPAASSESPDRPRSPHQATAEQRLGARLVSVAAAARWTAGPRCRPASGSTERAARSPNIGVSPGSCHGLHPSCTEWSVRDLPIYASAKVHRDHHIEVAKALYSMPGNLIGSRVEVRADRVLVRVFQRGQLVKVHPRQPPGRRRTLERSVSFVRDSCRL